MADSMLTLAINFDPDIKTALGRQFYGTELERNITALKSAMLTDDFQTVCAGLSSFDRTAMTNTWRNNMWTYLLNIIDTIRTNDVMATFIAVVNVMLQSRESTLAHSSGSTRVLSI